MLHYSMHPYIWFQCLATQPTLWQQLIVDVACLLSARLWFLLCKTNSGDVCIYGRQTATWGGRWTSSRRCWSATRSGSTSAWPWARSYSWRRCAKQKSTSGIFSFMCFATRLALAKMFNVFAVQAGEDVLQGQKHAGPPSAGPLHHRATRSLLHRAVDGWIRLPEPHQVSRRTHLSQ